MMSLSGLSLASSEALGGAPRSWAAFWPLLGSRGNKEVLRRYLNRVVKKKNEPIGRAGVNCSATARFVLALESITSVSRLFFLPYRSVCGLGSVEVFTESLRICRLSRSGRHNMLTLLFCYFCVSRSQQEANLPVVVFDSGRVCYFGLRYLALLFFKVKWNM